MEFSNISVCFSLLFFSLKERRQSRERLPSHFVPLLCGLSSLKRDSDSLVMLMRLVPREELFVNLLWVLFHGASAAKNAISHGLVG